MDQTGYTQYQFSHIVTFIDWSTIAVKVKFLHHVLEVLLYSLLRTATSLMEDKLCQIVKRSIVAKDPSLEIMEIIFHVLCLFIFIGQSLILTK